jgi:hypothetical protein
LQHLLLLPRSAWHTLLSCLLTQQRKTQQRELEVAQVKAGATGS